MSAVRKAVRRAVQKATRRAVKGSGGSTPPPSYTVNDFELEGITVATFEAGGNTDVSDFEANGYIP